MRRVFKKSRWWFLVIVIIASLLLVNITKDNSGLYNRIGLPITSIMAPLQKLLSEGTFLVRDSIGMIPKFFQLKSEYEALQKKIDELEQYKVMALEYQQENTNLRNMLGLKTRSFQYEMAAAQVIGRDPGNWFNVIIIDKGENDGIEKDMAVITEQGLAGCVLETGNNQAKVLLITDERSSVSAMIQRTRDNGILKGTIDPAPKGYLKMEFLPQDATLIKGDTVITSGLGGMLPKGIVIGEIVETNKQPHELMQYAIVKPVVDLNKLEHVFVITKHDNYHGGENP